MRKVVTASWVKMVAAATSASFDPSTGKVVTAVVVLKVAVAMTASFEMRDMVNRVTQGAAKLATARDMAMMATARDMAIMCCCLLLKQRMLSSRHTTAVKEARISEWVPEIPAFLLDLITELDMVYLSIWLTMEADRK
jgi:hypothetical protein